MAEPSSQATNRRRLAEPIDLRQGRFLDRLFTQTQTSGELLVERVCGGSASWWAPTAPSADLRRKPVSAPLEQVDRALKLFHQTETVLVGIGCFVWESSDDRPRFAFRLRA